MLSKLLFFPLKLNVKLWWSLYSMVIRNLFRHKARSLIFRKENTFFNEVKNSAYGSNASLNDEKDFQEASSRSTSTVIHDSRTPQKN